MARTGFVYHPQFADHLTGPGHPERPARVQAIATRVREAGLLDDLDPLEPGAADPAALASVHEADYIRRVEAACAAGPGVIDTDETTISRGSWQAALLAVGGALEAADRIVDRRWKSAFIACRPPGHHAEAAMAMGFCLFNTAAVAARHLRDRRGLERVAILDWDVHHGNGTQHAFESDPSVYYASLHQWPLYPGTGRADERGIGAGHGTTLNCPMPPGAGDDEYFAAFETLVLPELERFAPQFIILSAGFDAHAADPLSATRVTTPAYRRMTRLIAALAAEKAGGRILSLLEGGYDLAALAASVEVHLEELHTAPAPVAAPGTPPETGAYQDARPPGDRPGGAGSET